MAGVSKKRKKSRFWFIRMKGYDLEFGTARHQLLRLIMSWIPEERCFAERISLVFGSGIHRTTRSPADATVEDLLPYVPDRAKAALLAASIEAANAPEPIYLGSWGNILAAGAVTANKIAAGYRVPPYMVHELQTRNFMAGTQAKIVMVDEWQDIPPPPPPYKFTPERTDTCVALFTPDISWETRGDWRSSWSEPIRGDELRPIAIRLPDGAKLSPAQPLWINNERHSIQSIRRPHA